MHDFPASGYHCQIFVSTVDYICRTCELRLKSCDDAFRHQLEAKQKAHDSHVTRIVAQKDQQIAQANQRVSQKWSMSDAM